MLSRTWSTNARNSVSVIIEPARITEFRVFHLARSRMVLRIVATLAATGLVAACGFKGPLYLPPQPGQPQRSEEHTSELQSLMRISYAVFCLKQKNNKIRI